MTKALDVGYRAIDTAAAYENEAEVGGAINGSGIDRSELFVTTKLWNSNQGRDRTKAAFEESLSKLGLDYLDLYLIHWPVPSKGLFVETWQAMEELRDDGRVRSIGVSNFREEDLERLAHETDTVPALNQIELHPSLQQRGLREAHSERGIVTQAWSPLGQGELFDDAVLTEIAKSHSKSTGSGDAALADGARQRDDPQVGHGRADRGQLRDLGLRALRGRHERDLGARRGHSDGSRPVRIQLSASEAPINSAP